MGCAAVHGFSYVTGLYFILFMSELLRYLYGTLNLKRLKNMFLVKKLCIIIRIHAGIATQLEYLN